jgi:hypothetical protein
MIAVKYKVKKVKSYDANGVLRTKFVPICKKSLFGIGFWRDCTEWENIERKIEGERYLGLDADSTLTHIRKFIDEKTCKNEYYHE